MRRMSLAEIRKEFLEFFRKKNHAILPSYSLVPEDDDSLLLIGAGMAPMKKYFTGELKPKNKRVATSQKCIRTGDIENVGVTARHATFFEMLGNFSFGDYFKEEAIHWAWEFMTENLKVDPQDIWITVYLDDDEAERIWNEEINIPLDRIIRLGKDSNFWELEVGPSGPCSEIFIDRGSEYGCGDSSCNPGCDCDRFLEVWNLVFSQYDKISEGVYEDLQHPGIDTGMGLERITAVSQGVDSIFEIEEMKKIISSIEKLSTIKYGDDTKNDISIRIITDHVRAMTFLISDGVRPGNESRDYVLRRIIRRAARHGKLLGINGSFLHKLIKIVVELWGGAYPELKDNQELIETVIENEEKRFQKTIDQGLNILNEFMEDMIENDVKILDGKSAFKLYDTYGFPLDLTEEILDEKGFSVEKDGFNEEMEAQRKRAREARKNDNVGWSTGNDASIYEELYTEFLGYKYIETTAKIIGIFAGENNLESAIEGQDVILILDQTSFYPEGGGQVGDKGIIATKDGKFKVLDTQKTNLGHILHIGTVVKGNIKLDEIVDLKPNLDRKFTRRNHTATHLLHQALKDVLGDEVNQAGSEVGPNQLRFDFSYPKAVSLENLIKIEKIVNEKIFEAIEVIEEWMPLEEANSKGIVGLFEDKYDEIVRVLSIGDYSIELCGGLHISNTDEIGIFKIVSESSVAAGIRRIEAITSRRVYDYLNEQENLLDLISKQFNSDRKNLQDKITSSLNNTKHLEEELEVLKTELAGYKTGNLLDNKIEIKDTFLINEKIENVDMNGLRKISDNLKDGLNSGLIALAGVNGDKIYFVVSATDDLVKRGVNSGDIVREMAKTTGGSGGGRANMAQAGGKDLEKIDEALNLAKTLLEEALN